MKKRYNKPILDISVLGVEDVLSTSNSDGNFVTGDEIFSN